MSNFSFIFCLQTTADWAKDLIYPVSIQPLLSYDFNMTEEEEICYTAKGGFVGACDKIYS